MGEFYTVKVYFTITMIYNETILLCGVEYMNKVSRNFGIDLLRFLSMLSVVFLHVLGHGGILKSDLSPANFSMVWFIEILAYPAVNCFVLISGYIGYKEEKIFPKIKNLLTLAFTVALL
jgi:surface polysaccharide O-acyltransferase-like enzyme